MYTVPWLRVWQRPPVATGRELVVTQIDPVATGRKPVATQIDPVATGREPIAIQTNPIATGYNPVAIRTVTIATEKVGVFSIQNAPRCIITKHYIYTQIRIHIFTFTRIRIRICIVSNVSDVDSQMCWMLICILILFAQSYIPLDYIRYGYWIPIIYRYGMDIEYQLQIWLFHLVFELLWSEGWMENIHTIFILLISLDRMSGGVEFKPF
jgi:hypothetical protein